jgi:tRNA pseudouridine38-40 synthase
LKAEDFLRHAAGSRRCGCDTACPPRYAGLPAPSISKSLEQDGRERTIYCRKTDTPGHDDEYDRWPYARYKLIIGYDGAPFCGWQIRTMALGTGALEDAVKAICGGTFGSARAAPTPVCMRWGRSRIAILPSISCGALSMAHAASAAASDRRALGKSYPTFEARFSAKRRHYRYRISNRRANLALDIGHVWRRGSR